MVEHVPGAVELPGEEALGERRRVRLRLDTGIEVQLFEARDRVAHLTAGVVDALKRAFGELEGVLGEVDDIAAVALLELGFEHVGRFLDAADVAPDLPIGDELPVGEGLLDQRAQGRDVRPATRRRRGSQQQLASQRFVVVGVVDQNVDQLALGKRLEMGTRVIERRRGIVVLALPSKGDRDAVLAEGALTSDRARAGEAKLPAFGTKLDQVVLGALDGGADALGARSQRPDPSRFEIGQAALVGGRRREAGDGFVEHLR